ncbi:hypothetical protein IQ07DRAFT_585112 [Pyrenochaeta sp. DS3sAY3a]|nr:hypothetical protein IQ07DRAFT_585112 [Pyrenochaeta sp. DS3sAY3a]
MRFAKAQEKKMGKPEETIKKREPQKSPISKVWIVFLRLRSLRDESICMDMLSR